MHGKLDGISNPAGTKLGHQSSIDCPRYRLPAHLHILMENTKCLHSILVHVNDILLPVVLNSATESRSKKKYNMDFQNKEGRVHPAGTAD